MTIRVGTSGWSYPTGKGTWNGIFYPASAQKRKTKKGGFDDLAFYAEHFNTVEVNSSFYGVPPVQTTQGWAERTPEDFEFSLKLYQKFTHPKMYKEATGEEADLAAEHRLEAGIEGRIDAARVGHDPFDLGADGRQADERFQVRAPELP